MSLKTLWRHQVPRAWWAVWMVWAPITGHALSLPQALDAVAQHSVALQAQHAADAAEADVVTASRAPLPVLSAKAGSIDLQHGVGAGNVWSDKRIDAGVGVDWTWERGDKRPLRTRLYQQNMRAAHEDRHEVLLQQRLLAFTRFYDWRAAQERLALMNAIAQSAATLMQTGQQRLKAGDLSEQDALRLTIEAERARAEVAQARLDWQQSAWSLAQSTGLAGDPLTWQPETDWPSFVPEIMRSADKAPWQDWVLQRPGVRAAQARVMAAHEGVQWAQALRQSDVTWGLAADHFPGTSARLLELRMQMPLQWGDVHAGAIRRAAALHRQAQAAADQAQLDARTELMAAWQSGVAAGERLAGYQTRIGPAAARVAQQAEWAYRKGALSLTDLLDARRTLKSIQLESIDWQRQFACAWGRFLLLTRPVTQVIQDISGAPTPSVP